MNMIREGRYRNASIRGDPSAYNDQNLPPICHTSGKVLDFRLVTLRSRHLDCLHTGESRKRLVTPSGRDEVFWTAFPGEGDVDRESSHGSLSHPELCSVARVSALVG